jgi:biotin carboxyl carrier protein
MPGEDETFKVKVNDFQFCISAGQVASADLQKLSSLEYNLIKDYRSVNVKITDPDPFGKKLSVEISGEIFSIEITNELERVIEQMGLGAGKANKVKEIKAPMPGLVLEVSVSDGQDVNEGDKILILEAMKMENNIMIHTSARIKKIAVAAGQAVEKGQLLVELE